jgi:hypothetical protein
MIYFDGLVRSLYNPPPLTHPAGKGNATLFEASLLFEIGK